MSVQEEVIHELVNVANLTGTGSEGTRNINGRNILSSRTEKKPSDPAFKSSCKSTA